MTHENIVFKTTTKLGKRLKLKKERWDFIVENKHGIMKGREKEVERALSDPLEVRRSVKDENVFLYYAESEGHCVCVVVKHQDGDGFLITAYITDKIKAGESVWKR